MSTVIRREGGGFHLFAKGTAEIMLKKCSFILNNEGHAIPLTSTDQENLMSVVIEPMANDGLRTLCIAYKTYVPGRLFFVEL